MPHIKLEYTKIIKIDKIKSIFKEISHLLVNEALVKEENCKFKSFQTPFICLNNTSKHFYHLEISILSGRSEKVLQLIGQKGLDTLIKHITKKPNKSDFQFSVEIKELESKKYYTTNNI
tara:strand:+ start:1890 stop:2246 length:357 start_codon:yes stop_codon:yes gene_type:complete